MTTDRLKAACAAEPFRPFDIHLADGRAVPVGHPEFIISSPSGRTVVVFQPDDTMNIIDMLLVTDLEFRPSSNGKKRRKSSGGKK